MTREEVISHLHENVESASEETFLLFSQQIPSRNLGFVDAHATSLEVTIAGRDFEIVQSPTILASNRSAGTTGAVLWKVTPLIAEWLCREDNVLRKAGYLSKESVVLELGCGISGLIALTVAPQVRRYIATDQSYVLKLLNENISNNTSHDVGRKKQLKPKGKSKSSEFPGHESLRTMSLDWELDDPSNLPSLIDEGSDSIDTGIDLIVACDCIYNDALINPLVRTTAELCRLRSQSDSRSRPTVCIIAQQLRSSDVMEAWLEEMMESFDIWRLPDELLMEGLRENSGFVVHLALLKTT